MVRHVMRALICLFFWVNAWFLEAQEASTASYPTVFANFKLGMKLEEVKQTLSQSSDFLWRGDPDVTLLSKLNTGLIDVAGIGFFHRGIFQFLDGLLYIMTFELNPQELDYYTLYTTLTKKYGNPTSLDPAIARWENDKVYFTLEKPLQVKYINKPVFFELQKKGSLTKSAKKLMKEKFLENF